MKGIYAPVSYTHLDVYKRQDVLTLIVAQGSRLCEPEQVALDDVLREPLLLREPGSACRALVDRLLEERGRAVEPAWESASTQALVRAVEAGLGVALLPERLVRDDVAAGRVCARAIQGVELRYEFSAVWHKMCIRDRATTCCIWRSRRA